MHERKRAGRSVVMVAAVAVAALAISLFMFSRQEVRHFSTASGEFAVVVSTARYERFLWRIPGDAGGPPGFVEIFDRDGKSHGRIKVPMIQLADELHWTDAGAEIRLIGEWNFKSGTCFYFSEDQDRKIWVRR